MKKIIIPISIFLLIFLGTIVIILNNEVVVDEIIILEENHIYIYKNERNFSVDLYINNNDSLLLRKESYKSSFVSNTKNENRHNISIKDISLVDSELYLEKTYYHYILSFTLPSSENAVLIKDCLLNIGLSNNKNYEFMIGSLEVYMTNYNLIGSNYPLFLMSLDVVANNEVNSQRVSKIHINFDFLLNINISRIIIGHYNETTFDILGNIVTIYIKNEKMILDNFPILIYYYIDGEEKEQVFDNMQMLTTYRNLIKDDVKKNTYVFS